MKEKSLSLNFMSFILADFFLCHALEGSLAHSYQAADGYEAPYMEENHLSALNQVVETYNNVVKAKKAIGGRKMILGYDGAQDGHHELVMHNRPRAMLSVTEDRNALKNPSYSSPDSTHRQVEESVFCSPGSSKQIMPTRSRKLVTQDNAAKARKYESDRRSEGAREMMKLMNKDYGAKWRPKKKPPIHNSSSKG